MQGPVVSGNDSWKAIIITNDNVSCIMINQGAWMVYWKVELLYKVLPRDLRASAVLMLGLDHSDHTIISDENFWNHELNKCVTVDALHFVRTD